MASLIPEFVSHEWTKCATTDFGRSLEGNLSGRLVRFGMRNRESLLHKIIAVTTLLLVVAAIAAPTAYIGYHAFAFLTGFSIHMPLYKLLPFAIAAKCVHFFAELYFEGLPLEHCLPLYHEYNLQKEEQDIINLFGKREYFEGIRERSKNDIAQNIRTRTIERSEWDTNIVDHNLDPLLRPIDVTHETTLGVDGRNRTFLSFLVRSLDGEAQNEPFLVTLYQEHNLENRGNGLCPIRSGCWKLETSYISRASVLFGKEMIDLYDWDDLSTLKQCCKESVLRIKNPEPTNDRYNKELLRHVLVSHEHVENEDD